MITGAVILFAGILIGYSIRQVNNPLPQKVQTKIKSFISKKATIVDMSPDVELGE